MCVPQRETTGEASYQRARTAAGESVGLDVNREIHFHVCVSVQETTGEGRIHSQVLDRLSARSSNCINYIHIAYFSAPLPPPFTDLAPNQPERGTG